MQRLQLAILIRTDREGRDPDTYYVAVLPQLWEQLDPSDPWKSLGVYIDAKDKGVLTDIESTRKHAVKVLRTKGFKVLRTEYAVGY